MKRKLYLKVTSDKYELPLVVADSAIELAEKLGVSRNLVYSHISHMRNGNVKKSSIHVVEVDDDD